MTLFICLIRLKKITTIAWLGQELLTTFDTLIGELAIIPGSAAVFQIKVDDGKITL